MTTHRVAYRHLHKDRVPILFLPLRCKETSFVGPQGSPSYVLFHKLFLFPGLSNWTLTVVTNPLTGRETEETRRSTPRPTEHYPRAPRVFTNLDNDTSVSKLFMGGSRVYVSDTATRSLDLSQGRNGDQVIRPTPKGRRSVGRERSGSPF